MSVFTHLFPNSWEALANQLMAVALVFPLAMSTYWMLRAMRTVNYPASWISFILGFYLWKNREVNLALFWLLIFVAAVWLFAVIKMLAK